MFLDKLQSFQKYLQSQRITQEINTFQTTTELDRYYDLNDDFSGSCSSKTTLFEEENKFKSQNSLYWDDEKFKNWGPKMSLV